MKRHKAKQVIGAVRALGASKRAERASAVPASGQTVAAPNVLDSLGRITTLLTDNLVLRGGALGQEVDGETLVIAPGSPRRITVRSEGLISSDESMAVDSAGKLSAQPKTSQVQNDTSIEGGDLLEVLERIQTNKENKIEKGAADGYCPLDSSALVPLANLPTGSGAGLDADTIDGVDSADLVIDGDAAGGALTGTYPNPEIRDDADMQSPHIETDIKDVNGAVLVSITPTGSAVNYFTWQNNVLGAAPRLGVEGSDTNIDFPLQTKGSGLVKARYSGVNYEVETVKSYTAKGDLIAGTAASARGVVSPGTNGKFLRADSSQTAGLGYVYVEREIGFHTGVTANLTWTSFPASNQFILNSERHTRRFDLSNCTQIRIVINKIGTAGSAGSKVGVYYKTSWSATAGDYSSIGTSAVEVAVDVSAGGYESSWIDITASARADVYLAIQGYGGDGATNPQFGTIVVQVR